MIGMVAMRMPASCEVVVCSPEAIRKKGSELPITPRMRMRSQRRLPGRPRKVGGRCPEQTRESEQHDSADPDPQRGQGHRRHAMLDRDLDRVEGRAPEQREAEQQAVIGETGMPGLTGGDVRVHLKSAKNRAAPVTLQHGAELGREIAALLRRQKRTDRDRLAVRAEIERVVRLLGTLEDDVQPIGAAGARRCDPPRRSKRSNTRWSA